MRTQSYYQERTNRIIKAMCNAGYKRNEFKVHTPVGSWGDHGETEITVNASIKRQDELLVPVLNTEEIDVVKYIQTGEDGIRKWWYIYYSTYNRPDRYTVHDIDAENEETNRQIKHQIFEKNLKDATPHLLDLVRKLANGIGMEWGYGTADQTLALEAKKLLRHYKLFEEETE